MHIQIYSHPAVLEFVGYKHKIKQQVKYMDLSVKRFSCVYSSSFTSRSHWSESEMIRYSEKYFVSLNSNMCYNPLPVVLYAISFNIGRRYSSTQQYMCLWNRIN